MCGILGVSRRFELPAGAFAAAVEAIRWRGPDGVVELEVEGWQLAVARLAITDPAADQPIWSRDRERVVLANGTLTSAVSERPAHDLQGGNDVELLLHRLAGGDGGALLSGPGHLAAAVLEPARGRVWLSQDHFGEKPLFLLLRDGELLAFASTLASLRALGVELQLQAGELARLLRFGFCAGPGPRDRGLRIERLLAGTRLFEQGQLVRTWPAQQGERVREARDLREALQDACVRNARVEVPLGLSLSGGLDSACIAAALARAELPHLAYQFAAGGTPRAERQRAEAVARQLQLELRPVDGGPEILRALPDLTAATAQVLGDPSVLAVHALCRAAAADGVKVMLSGEGADETFAGYRRHRLARFLPASGWPLLGSLAGAWSRRTWARALRALGSRSPYAALLEAAPPGLRQQALAPELRAGELPAGPAGPLLDQALAWDRQCYLPWDLLPKLDSAAMAAGIEGRSPFLDPAVQGTAAAQRPARARLGKRDLRAAFAAELPAVVLRGPKQGFGLPLDRWWREDDYMPDLLLSDRSLSRPHLQAGGLRKAVDAQRAGRIAVGHALYVLCAYELWLRGQEAVA